VQKAGDKLKASGKTAKKERKKLKKTEMAAKESFEENKDQAEEKIEQAESDAKGLQVDAAAAKTEFAEVKKEAKQAFDAKHPRAVVRQIKNLKRERRKASKVIQAAADAEAKVTDVRSKSIALEKKLKKKEESTIGKAKRKERETAKEVRLEKSKARKILRKSVKVSKAKKKVEKMKQEVRKLRRKARGEIHDASGPVLAKAQADVDRAKQKADVTAQLVDVLQRIKTETDADAKRTLEVKATKLQAQVAAFGSGSVETQETSVEAAKQRVRKARIALGTATRGKAYESASKALLEAKQDLRKVLRTQQNHESLDWKYDQEKKHLERVTKVLDEVKGAQGKSLSLLRKAKKEGEVNKAKKEFQKASVLTSSKLRREVRVMEKKIHKDAAKENTNKKITKEKKIATKGKKNNKSELVTLDFTSM